MRQWIYTSSGERLYFDRLGRYDYPIEEIATCLSRICRFAGHTQRNYSVAEHSVWVYREVKRLGFDTRTQIAALLHDAEEAYLGDVTRPLKQLLASATLRTLSQQITYEVFVRHGADGTNHRAIEQADKALLATEWEQVFEHQPPPEPFTDNALDIELEFLEPLHAQILFLMAYEELQEELAGESAA